jgi:hypothetical protein
VVSTTPRPLYPGKRPGTHCIGSWVGEKSRSHRDSIPGPPSPQPVAIPTELSRPPPTQTVRFNPILTAKLLFYHFPRCAIAPSRLVQDSTGQVISQTHRPLHDNRRHSSQQARGRRLTPYAQPLFNPTFPDFPTAYLERSQVCRDLFKIKATCK